MNQIKVGAAALNQTPLDWEGNYQNILAAINQAKSKGIKLLCLPELCITGYGCEDFFHAPYVLEKAFAVLEKIKEETTDIAICVGLPVSYRNRVFNSSAFIANKKILGINAKRYLASDGVHYEPRWFIPWKKGENVLLDNGVPFGDLCFDLQGVKIGQEICRDAWTGDRPGDDLQNLGVDIILNPSGSHFSFYKFRTRERFITEASRIYGAAYIYCNLLGCESGKTIFDGDCIIASEGQIIASNERFSLKNFELTSAIIDLNKNRSKQLKKVEESFTISEKEIVVIRDDFSLYSQTYEINELYQIPAWQRGQYLKEEEFFRAVTLGLFDYLRKSGSHGFVVSLSGGADSSAVCCLVVLMIRRCFAELDLDNLRTRLPILKKTDIVSQEDAIRNLLTCAYQSTSNSSAETYESAKSLAQELNVQFHNLNLDDIFKSYTNIIERAVSRKLVWETDDAALQNIQSRIRSPGIWLLANLNNALLLTTGNRSEASVGYCTMDGDTSGGLNPIGGVDKSFILQWLSWLQLHGPDGYAPIRSLEKVNSLQPTAELRPKNYRQTDEKDLMPYKVLNFIEREAIFNKQSPSLVYQATVAKFGDQFESKEIAIWVKKFYSLWSVSQWKRVRMASAFHVDDYNVDPYSWCRFPILSGKFKEELNSF